MNTCRTCKHWTDAPQLPEHVPASNRICYRLNLGDVGNDFTLRTARVVHADTDSGYFSTGADFGCLHHENLLPTGNIS